MTFFFCRFLDQIWLKKTVLWTNITQMLFLIQYGNILQFTKTFAYNMCILSLKNQKRVEKAFFMTMTKK